MGEYGPPCWSWRVADTSTRSSWTESGGGTSLWRRSTTIWAHGIMSFMWRRTKMKKCRKLMWRLTNMKKWNAQCRISSSPLLSELPGERSGNLSRKITPPQLYVNKGATVTYPRQENEEHSTKYQSTF